MKVVADSSVLINLCKISRLDLLKHFEVLIPEAVWREVVEEGKGRAGAEEVKKAGFKVRKITNLKLYNLLRAYLDAGESEVITLASFCLMRRTQEILRRSLDSRLWEPLVYCSGQRGWAT